MSGALRRPRSAWLFKLAGFPNESDLGSAHTGPKLCGMMFGQTFFSPLASRVRCAPCYSESAERR
jgi:hypothetical protein